MPEMVIEGRKEIEGNRETMEFRRKLKELGFAFQYSLETRRPVLTAATVAPLLRPKKWINRTEWVKIPCRGCGEEHPREYYSFGNNLYDYSCIPCRKEKAKDDVKNLANSYVRSRAARTMKIATTDVPDHVLPIFRAIQLVKRACKEKGIYPS